MEIEAEDRADPVRDNCVGRRVRGRRAYAVAFSIVLVLAVISMASMLTAALLALLVGSCVGTTLRRFEEKASRFSAGMNPTLPFTLHQSMAQRDIPR